MRQQGGASHAVEISTESESSIVVQNSGYKNVIFEFVPASEYCYTAGFNIIRGKQIGNRKTPAI
jgi:hypothetical protein